MAKERRNQGRLDPQQKKQLLRDRTRVKCYVQTTWRFALLTITNQVIRAILFPSNGQGNIK